MFSAVFFLSSLYFPLFFCFSFPRCFRNGYVCNFLIRSLGISIQNVQAIWLKQLFSASHSSRMDFELIKKNKVTYIIKVNWCQFGNNKQIRWWWWRHMHSDVTFSIHSQWTHTLFIEYLLEHYCILIFVDYKLSSTQSNGCTDPCELQFTDTILPAYLFVGKIRLCVSFISNMHEITIKNPSKDELTHQITKRNANFCTFFSTSEKNTGEKMRQINGESSRFC